MSFLCMVLTLVRQYHLAPQHYVLYTLQGSSVPTPCDPGTYCETEGLANATGLCIAGYYCEGEASVSNPVQCQSGHYCPEGTAVEQLCPSGTFRSKCLLLISCQQFTILYVVCTVAIHWVPYCMTVFYLFLQPQLEGRMNQTVYHVPQAITVMAMETLYQMVYVKLDISVLKV